ncbi:MAG TPA: flagellar basal body P-ring formation chaperone FlgA [Vicinamibacterales bacterium]
MSTSVTDMFGRVILGLVVVAMLMAAARAAFAAAPAVTPIDAIEKAVARRLGSEAAVSVTGLETSVRAQQGLQALPEPGARAGQPVRFVLMAAKSRVGVAMATVMVSGPHARAARAIARDEAITEADIEIVDDEWPSVPLTRLPVQDEIIGLKARRNIAPGEALTSTVLDVPPAVRSGDVVTVTATVGAVQVTAAATASSSGHRGDVIRVTPKPNGRPVRARITGPAAVEVVQ